LTICPRVNSLMIMNSWLKINIIRICLSAIAKSSVFLVLGDYLIEMDFLCKTK